MLNFSLYAPKSDQLVTIEIPQNVKTIACGVSGGADTAILFYILAKHIKDSNLNLKILPVNRSYMDRPTVKDALLITERVRELIGGDTSYILPLHSETASSKSPRIFHAWFEHKLLESGDADMFFAGLTANPQTQEYYEKYGYHQVGGGRRGLNDFEVEPKRRIFSNHFREIGKTTKKIHFGREVPDFPEDFPEVYVNEPFLNVDKRFVAEMYDLYDVRDSLLPITWTCDGSYMDTFGYTKPCKKCFNCVEKEWAFGHFDFDRKTYCEELSHLRTLGYNADGDWHFTDNYKKYIDTKPWWWRVLNKYFFKLHRKVNVDKM